MMKIFSLCCLTLLLCTIAHAQILSNKDRVAALEEAHVLIIARGELTDPAKIGIASATQLYNHLHQDQGGPFNDGQLKLLTGDNATKEGIEKQLTALLDAAGKSKPLVVVYFGPMIGNGSGVPHLIPADANLGRKTFNDTTLKSTELATALAGKREAIQLHYFADPIPFRTRVKHLSGRVTRKEARKQEVNPVQAVSITAVSYKKVGGVDRLAFRFVADLVWLNREAASTKGLVALLKPLNNTADYFNRMGMRFRYVKPGIFEMGTEGKAWRRPDNEVPRHRVKLSQPYWLGVHEVTKDQFKRFTIDEGYQTEAEKFGESLTWQAPGFQKEQAGDEPAIYISYKDALAFNTWLSKEEGVTYDLPTEAQWAYVARTGQDSRLSFNVGPEKGIDTNWANYIQRWRKTTRVGFFMPNNWGFYDMHGNAAEWVKDYYGAFDANAKIDPTGPRFGKYRFVRGGAWHSGMKEIHIASRIVPELHEGEIPYATGFRILADVKVLPDGD